MGEIAEETEVREKSEYTYGDSEWKDLLTGFKLTAESSSDNIDTQITYDANGNVTAFDGSTYTWTAGRQLESSSGDDNTVRYFYNENGYLTRVDFYDEDTDSYPGGIVFIWDGDRLVSRSIVLYESNLEFMTSRIIYDSDGEAQGFSLVYNDDSGESSMKNTVFLYRKNLQGDITGIILPDGSLAAEFTYDAYGNVELHPAENTLGGALLAIFMLAVTPQLYRGYIYVPVGGNLCYYLGSRFYSPKLGRFLNADIHTDTGTGVVGTNMFAYCNNNPVVFIDPTGEASKKTRPEIAMSTFFDKIKSLVRSVFAYNISNKGISMAPGSAYIATMKYKDISYGYVDNYSLYFVVTVLYTQKVYRYEKYTIETVSATVKNWYKLIDKVEYYEKLYNILSVSNAIGLYVYDIAELSEVLLRYSMTLASFVNTVTKIAAAIEIPAALVMMLIGGGTSSKIGTEIRGMNVNARYTFNWQVTKDFWVLGMPETEHTVIDTVYRFF